MRKIIVVLSVVWLLSFQSASAQAVKERRSEETIKLSSELVALDVQLIDRKTQRSVSGLTQKDFEIYEDGVRQQIEQFSQDKLPLSVALLLDASSSMYSVLDRLRANALEALQSLKPEDEVALMVTAEDTRLIEDFTKDKFTVSETLRQLDLKSFGDNGILLHDSLYRVATHFQETAKPVDRRVIIVITDNITIPAYNWRYFQKEQAVEMVLESGVVVYGIVINRNLLTRADRKLLGFPRGGGDVHSYADMTGGEVLNAGNDSAGQKLIELINHLRTRYTLAFVPSNTKRDGKFRRLKVRLAAATEQRLSAAGVKDLALRTRSGYYAPKK
ncbi:MAG TPA: VWA domain-containing protein [Blastocatellia bacterium]